MDTREFFQSIYGSAVGYAVIVLPNYDGKPVNDYWFEYPAQLDDMVKTVHENRTNSVWFSPNIFGGKARNKETSLTLNVAAADADSCEPDNFRMPPSIVIESSPGRYQVYWVLDGDNDSAVVAKVNRRIAQVHKDQGCDPAFVNQAKLMRVPGSSNHKHPGAVTNVSELSGDTYTLEQIVRLYPESEVPDAVDVSYANTELPDDLEEYMKENRSGLLSGLPNSAVLKDLMFGKYHDDKRSEARFKLLCELYRIGLEDRAVMTLAWGAMTNKYVNDPRGYAGLWAEAMKAKAYMGVASGESESAEITQEEIEKYVSAEAKTYNFLTVEEAEEVAKSVNFVDEWVNWASKATDAPVEYHRTSALTILSTIYSQYGHVRPSFARNKREGMKLNVWFMTLGRSTKERKSTARGLMLHLLERLGGDDREYLFPEDFTPSSLSLLLPDWKDLSVLYARDETQGLFKELLNQSYMSGGVEAMTKLYDGRSPSRARATGDRKVTKSVPVSFIMYLTGILDETTDVLTLKDFKSGFLTRFVYTTASRPENYEQPSIEQAPPDTEEDEGDSVLDGFINRFQMNRNYWEAYAGDSTTRIYVEEDAWARYQQFEKDVWEAAANTTSHREAVSANSDRMIISVLKISAVLAMDERSGNVKMHHMLQAIGYAGEWFRNLELIASMISQSEWERDVNELEKFIAGKGGRCTYAQAYRNFADKKPQEFDQMVQSLTDRGSCERIQAGNSWTLKLKSTE